MHQTESHRSLRQNQNSQYISSKQTHTTERNQHTTKRWNKIPTLQKTEAEHTNIPPTPNSSKHLRQLMAPHAPHGWRQTQNRNLRKIQKTGQELNHLSQQQSRTPQPHHKFYPRIIYTTDINFSEQEMTLLEKGPKYNLHSKPKDWIRNLALEAETAITQHPPPYRPRSLQKIDSWTYKTLIKENNPQHTHNTHPETKIVISIKTKLKEKEAMVTRADKGNSLVILPINNTTPKSRTSY